LQRERQFGINAKIKEPALFLFIDICNSFKVVLLIKTDVAGFIYCLMRSCNQKSVLPIMLLLNTMTISFTAQIPADEPISQYKLTQQI